MLALLVLTAALSLLSLMLVTPLLLLSSIVVVVSWTSLAWLLLLALTMTLRLAP